MVTSVSGLGGSNLDVNGIVQQLMAVERQPLAKLATKEASFQAKISAFGSLKSSLATMQNAVAGLKMPSSYNALDFYSTFKGTLADSSVATVTAGEGTVPGNYSLEVSQLAQQHRIVTSAGTTFSPGTLTIRLGSEDGSTTTKTTTIDLTSGSLDAVRDAINQSSAGVTAAVVNGAGGAQLVLTGNSGGSNQFIHLSGAATGNLTHQVKSNADVVQVDAVDPRQLTIRLAAKDGSNETSETVIDIAAGEDLLQKINASGAGVTASMDGGKLVLTANEAGQNRYIEVSGMGLAYDPDGAGNNFTETRQAVAEQQAAKSALLKLNGIDIESQSNTVTGALAGVTLTLTKETTTPTTLSLTRDTSSLNKALEKLVTAYNDYAKLSKEMGGYNEATKKLGVLGADSTLRGADMMLRQTLGSVAPGLAMGSTMRTLSDIGISVQRDGTLKLDSAKLEKAIASNISGVANVAAGIASSLDTTLTGLIGTKGSIVGKTEGLTNSVKSIDLQRTALEKRLEGTEARLRKQYVALDSLVSNMLQTSNYLQQQLASLSSSSGS